MNRILEESKVHIRTIVVPVDLSAVSEKTASYAVGLARNFGASIRFLHVFPPEAITEFTTGEVYEIYEREPSPVKERLAIFANYKSYYFGTWIAL